MPILKMIVAIFVPVFLMNLGIYLVSYGSDNNMPLVSTVGISITMAVIIIAIIIATSLVNHD